jgi:hypothetical protein
MLIIIPIIQNSKLEGVWVVKKVRIWLTHSKWSWDLYLSINFGPIPGI